jgi:eukaryotic-like serine/threonine-protein kinase
MVADDKGKRSGGLLGWLRGDKRADETGKHPAIKLNETMAAAATADAELTNDVSRRYNDRGEVARGGMGSIRKVFDNNLQRTIAMKVLFPEHRSDPKIRQRFAEEAQIMGQLEHPNIVPVHDYGEDDGTRFFTMYYVRGKTLTDLLKEHQGEDTREGFFRFLNVFLKVCDAVAFAHSRGVIHRDLKPDNIMVGNFGEVYLMDWGIARLLNRTGGGAGSATRTIAMPAIGTSVEDILPVQVKREAAAQDETGQIIGTFFYMSPEQALAEMEQIDERTDIFLLGGVLFEILTQQPPYMGSTVVDVVRQAQACQVLRPEMIAPEANIPKGLSDICMKCLQRDSVHRYQSVLELKRDLENFLKGGASFPVEVFKGGEHLMHEGDPGEECFIIQKGTVQVYRTDTRGRRRGLATLGPGSVVGEASVIKAAQRTASVVAIDDVQTVKVTRKQLQSELGLNSWLGDLVKALAERFFNLNDRYTKLDEGQVTLRVTNWVLQYLVLYGHTGPSTRREVQCSAMIQAAVAEFQKPDAELLAILKGAGSFTVDESRDVLYFSAGL